jgi:exoribonuclease-2
MHLHTPHRSHLFSPQNATRPWRLAVVVPGPGSLVEIEDEKSGARWLAVFDGPDPKNKKNALVRDVGGVVRSVPPRSVRHTVAGLPRAATVADAQLHAGAAAAALAAADAEETVALAWEMTQGEKAVPLAALSELLLGGADSTAQFAAYSLLETPVGRRHFKGRDSGEQYAPREPRDVAQLVAQADAEAALLARGAASRARVAAAAAARLADPRGAPPLAVPAEERAAFAAVARLGSYADVDEAELPSPAEEPEFSAARDFLRDTLQRKATPESARALLVAVGLWDAHETLALVRRRVPVAFSPELEDAAAALAAAPPPDLDAARRRDLAHLRCYAIDDASTTEVRAMPCSAFTGTQNPDPKSNHHHHRHPNHHHHRFTRLMTPFPWSP